MNAETLPTTGPRDVVGRDGETALSLSSAQLMLWMFLATVTMLFAGFTSAYLVRQASGSDWQPVPLVPMLWLNTTLMLFSSVTMEAARSRLSARAATWPPKVEQRAWFV